MNLNRIRTAGPQHEVAYQDLVKLVTKHAHVLTPVEILAIASNMLGKLIALQDQRTMTRQRALEIVTMNLEIGNKQAIDDFMHQAVQGRA